VTLEVPTTIAKTNYFLFGCLLKAGGGAQRILDRTYVLFEVT
jgi:hypothetical protein